jgi:adenylylsulfate kinase
MSQNTSDSERANFPLANANVIWHRATITRQIREKQNRHRSVLLWFTGLSGSGKSTLAHALEAELHKLGCRTIVLDGDNVRHGLCSDLGFSDKDRSENMRRIGEVSKLFIAAGVITLTAFISPFRSDRRNVRGMMPHGDFLEIYCNSSLDVCEARDIKGLYKRARSGEISNFTGISSPYEVPEHPDLVVNTGTQSIEESVATIIRFIKGRNIFP